MSALKLSKLKEAISKLRNNMVITKTEVDVDLNIEFGRVMGVIETAIEKLKFAIVLPYLLRNNATILVDHLTPEEVQFIQGICSKCTGTESGTSVMSDSKIQEKVKNGKSSSNEEVKKRFSERSISPQVMDPETKTIADIYQVIDIMWLNNFLKENAIEEYKDMLKENEAVFLECVAILKDVTNHKFSITAYEDSLNEKRLRKAWILNSEIEKKLNAKFHLLRKQKSLHESNLEAKVEIANNYSQQIEKLKREFSNDILSLMHTSEKEINLDTRASNQRQLDLAAEAKDITNQYETILNQHLYHEKRLRHKRAKVETQLSSWLTKYDSDIGDRQAEYEEINKGFEEEKAVYEDIKKKFDEQEIQYTILMAEKDEEDQKIWEANAFVFLRNRAARKIQRCWRAYRQRKIEKKKARMAKMKAKKSMENAPSKPPSGKKAKK